MAKEVDTTNQQRLLYETATHQQWHYTMTKLTQVVDSDDADDVSYCSGDLVMGIQFIGSTFSCTGGACMVDSGKFGGIGCTSCIVCDIILLRRKTNIVKRLMGNMALCRGAKGDTLREKGAVDALLGVLWRLIVPTLISTNCVGEESDVSLLPLLDTMSSLESSIEHDISCEKHERLCKEIIFFSDVAKQQLDVAALDLAIACLGSLRDLSCGSALTRAAILQWTPQSSMFLKDECDDSAKDGIENGIHLLTSYVARYHEFGWEKILSLNERCTLPFRTSAQAMQQSKEDSDQVMYTDRGKKELRVLSNALGAIRNTSHSTAANCQAFFNYGLVHFLEWRLMPVENSVNINTDLPKTQTYNEEHISSTPIHTKNNTNATILCASSRSSPPKVPDSTSPWREASYRSAGSLINLAEKCPSVARSVGSNRSLIYLLLEAWGGANIIAAINASQETAKNNANVTQSIDEAVPALMILNDGNEVEQSKNENNQQVISNLSVKLKGLPLLHLGLAAILHAADGGALEGGLDKVMRQVLEKEKIRKKMAQKREEQRKLMKMSTNENEKG